MAHRERRLGALGGYLLWCAAVNGCGHDPLAGHPDEDATVIADAGEDATAIADASRQADALTAPQPDGGSVPGYYEGPAYVRIEERDATGAGITSTTITANFAGQRIPYYKVVAESGNCRLLESNLGFCDPVCDGVCIGDGICVPFPTRLSAGSLTFTGMATPIVVQPDVQAGYYHKELERQTVPRQAVTVSAAGDSFGEFELSASVPEPLQLDQSGLIVLSADEDLTFSWNEADPDARVRLELNADTAAHAMIHPAVLQCDLPDTGTVIVPRSLLAEFRASGWSCENCVPSWINRYYRAETTVGGTPVEFRIISRRDIGFDTDSLHR